MHMSKREQNKKANREAILVAARDVFSQLGFGAATVRDIVRASGLAIGSFYNYFNDKDEAFAALVEAIVVPLARDLKAARAAAGTPQAFIGEPYRLVADFARTDSANAALIVKNQTLFRQTFYLTPIRTTVQTDLEADLGRWMEEGRLRRHDPVLMADAMLALGIDLVVQTALDPASASGRVAFLVDLFIARLAPAAHPSA